MWEGKVTWGNMSTQNREFEGFHKFRKETSELLIYVTNVTLVETRVQLFIKCRYG